MPRIRLHTWLSLGVLAIGLLLAAIGGLWAYMSATAIPIHPDANSVPSVSRSARAGAWSDTIDQARQRVRSAVAEQNLPGLSVAVGVNGEIVWAEGFGFADLENRTPVGPETRLRIGEVSMPLTSAAAGLLLEQKKLNLDDEIQRVVPEFPRKQWPVTIRELMAHTAGVRNDQGDEEPLLERCERTVDGVRRFAQGELLFEPGTRFRSSSYGWILVSAAVEKAANEPFFTFMRRAVFDPLGLTDTVPDVYSEDIPERATFYFPRFAGDTRYGPEAAREGDHVCFTGAGAYLSTPSDLVRFGMGLEKGKLLQPQTVTLLQTSQRLRSGEETGYGLGWKVETVPLAGTAARMASHGTKKDFIGGTASLLTFPDRGLVVALASNISFADTRSLGLTIADLFARRQAHPTRP